MLLEQAIEIRWATRNRYWYEGMGYQFTAYGDMFSVDVHDLIPSAKALVSYRCDYCNNILETTFGKYNSSKSIISKDSCLECAGKKASEVKAETFRRYVEEVYDHSDSPYKNIPLSQDCYATVDNKNYDKLIRMCRWSLSSAGGYAVGSIKQEDGRFKQVIMHRVIMDCPDGLEVDHRNGDKLLNIESNLRICTRQQNARNIPPFGGADKHSQFKGVTKNNKRWEVRIQYEGYLCRVGLFVNETAAANAYNHFASYLYGEYANLNECEPMDESEWRSYCTSREQAYPDKFLAKVNGIII